MPELPEVETVRADLAACLPKKKVLGVEILSTKSAQPTPQFMEKNLVGRSFLGAERLGKLLIFPLSGKLFLLVHLRMTGQLIYHGKDGNLAGGHSAHGKKEEVAPENLPSRHTRIIFKLSGGAKLYFNDLRKFGFCRLVDEAGLALAKKPYGVEPLAKEFDAQLLSGMVAKKKMNLKAFLLNQKFIAGLGNIYVDEALFAARLRPERLASSLKPAEIKKLATEIRRIIKMAIKLRGTTFSDYRDSQGRHGNFSKFLAVYGRGGEKCPNCGRPLKKKKLAGRGTHFCEYCQK